MKIVPYEKKYREDIQRICIDTGSPDNRIHAEHRKFSLLMYCDEYLDHETAFVLLDDDGIPQGYILCSENYDVFRKNMKPYLVKIRRECPSFAKRADISGYALFADRYPAHMHIDIEEKYAGHGRGTALMNVLKEHLRQNHVKGLMLGVDRNNTRACRFYQKNGFHVLKNQDTDAWMGTELDS